MCTRFGTQLRLVLLIAGALAVCAPGWSDAGVEGGSSNSDRLCYCDCEAKSGSAMCTHMCELTKYENRSWAVSCQKKAVSEPLQPAKAPDSHSSKDNKIHLARR